ncbi:MAG: GntR family transcriptional regulator [Negativicutes bacterium]
MEFSSNKPIFLQICDVIIDKLLSGELQPNERVLSVRDMGEKMLVNPNTVQRAYTALQEKGIVEQQRGIGFFITANAANLAKTARRAEFIKEQLPQMFRAMDLLGIDWKELQVLYKQNLEKGVLVR